MGDGDGLHMGDSGWDDDEDEEEEYDDDEEDDDEESMGKLGALEVLGPEIYKEIFGEDAVYKDTYGED